MNDTTTLLPGDTATYTNPRTGKVLTVTVVRTYLVVNRLGEPMGHSGALVRQGRRTFDADITSLVKVS